MNDLAQFPPWLIEALRCPQTGTPLRVEERGHETVLVAEPQGSVAGAVYPVRDGVPVLLAGEALDEER